MVSYSGFGPGPKIPDGVIDQLLNDVGELKGKFSHLESSQRDLLNLISEMDKEETKRLNLLLVKLISFFTIFQSIISVILYYAL